jgi:hypothetical protein
MLRLPLSVAFAAIAVAGFTPARAAEGEKDAKAIVAKAIEAKGGAATIDKYNGFALKFKGKFHGQGIEADMTGTTRLMLPDKQRTEAALDASGQAISYLLVYDGKKGWVSINGNPEELSNDQIAEARESVHLESLAALHGLSGDGVKLTSLGESKVDGKNAVGVKVSAKGFRDVSLFFDKDSGMVLMSETRAKDPTSGDEFKEIITFGDYKKVDGLMVPYKRAEKRDDKPYMEMEMTAVTPSEKLEDKDFGKP